MCGIGGWFSRAPRVEQGAAALNGLVDALKHRGPDGIAILEIDHVGLAHARLAMVDLMTGDQPMWSADRRCVIVFNGEIYNYRELRAHYEASGVTFATRSDTEVILVAYEREGVAGFGKLRGMFAFALWDTTQRRGLLVRDTLGIKPLFYRLDPDGRLSFASEAKGLLALTGERPKLDVGMLHLLLNFRYVPGTATLFQEISQLEPGECFEWRFDGNHVRGRFECALTAGDVDLDQVLTDSVGNHLIADVPIGCYLSGGIDSGLIAALTNANGAHVPTFTLAVGDDPAEAHNAADTARALGLVNTQAELADDELDRLPRMLWHLETPKVNALQLFRVAELARTQVKATLSGVGGDELFAGYNAHRIFNTCTKLPPRAAHATANVLSRLLPAASTPYGERDRAIQMGRAIGDWPQVYALLRNVWDSAAMRKWLYGPRLLDSPLPSALDHVRANWPTEKPPLAAMLQFEWRNKMVNDLLWQEDRASMAAGLEVRVPFVDAVVKNAVDKLGQPHPGKARLRAVAAGHLPTRVLERPKSGFQVDAPSFFDTHLRSLAAVWLSESRVRDYGLFNPATVRKLIDLPVRRRYRWHFFMLYLMIQSHFWIEIFERGQAPGALTNAR
jgi:asparagine synthase (glutamine-hydrolysing)